MTAEDIEAVAQWDPQAAPSQEIAFMPARVLLQDFTGVPAVVDLAAMRDAMLAMGADPRKINPLQPAELVIDHSVQVDEYGSAAALLINIEKEFGRNRERYGFLKWGQQAFENFKVVPPGTGIVHQVNLEYLGRVVMADGGDEPWAYPDTLVGTDSHTTMINGLGVLGWGVGGIEAEAAMLGQPISMLVPQVVGFRLTGELAAGATATDLVLTVTQMLREKGVVGKFVEYFGPGLPALPLADRATLANMAPEYGATCGMFPVDQTTLEYLRFTGRPAAEVALAEAYMKEQGLFHTPESPEAEYSDTMELDLSSVQPSLAGPKRPQDRILLGEVKGSFLGHLPNLKAPSGGGTDAVAVAEPQVETGIETSLNGQSFTLRDGSVVIAAITSCTNTSNPSVMVAAGPVGEESGRARAEDPALGEDLAGTGIQGGDGLPRRVRSHVLSRGAGVLCGGLWLHHLYRQQRSVAPADLEGRQGGRSGGGLGALGQSQFRRAHQFGCACQLSGLASPGSGLRVGRQHRCGSADRAPGNR